ncbi:hypothetical protein H072_9001 [Dactylellina haptotyla CBS 200.50]|uniref:Uncharacterized protein n=1 Tax=Dactylellina haptotyla (strain CBS 200.50) TaxID=1284197 RepID=S8BQ24_DACHA|nr:hypothetical protein H072_9001 [Dactylellina haptotyla CBS 200.50]
MAHEASNTTSIPDIPQTRPMTLEDDPFDDFDGVHFTRNPRPSDAAPARIGNDGGKRVSISAKEQPPLNAERGDLVYYPAPVPVMLNLPPKLSSTRFQTQAQTGIEEIRARRESLTSFRRSIALKASHSKAEASSLFDNILDATVISPVLSVVSHAITTSTATATSASATIPALRASAHLLAPPLRPGDGGDDGNDDGDGLSRPEDRLRLSAAGSSIENGEPVKEHPIGLTEGYPDGQPRASQYPHSSHSDTEDEDLPFVPATLLAELESRKTQQRARTNKGNINGDTRQVSTLLERDAIAEVKQKARKRGPVNLAWQSDHNAVEEEEDEVPLGLLYAAKLSSRPNEILRTPGLLAMREAEDNEPLRRRQERLKNTVKDPSDTFLGDTIDDKETLGQRRNRLQAAQRQRDASGWENPTETEEPEVIQTATINSMSSLLHSNPQKHSYASPLDNPSRGLLNSELPFGYQAQQQMHVNFMGNPSPNRQSLSQRKHLSTQQYDYPSMTKGREYEFGIPFPYAPVNAEYLQHQQALLADQIERWRSSVW